MIQIIVIVLLVILIGVYFFMKRGGSKEAIAPAQAPTEPQAPTQPAPPMVSEDVNLPAVEQEKSPSQVETPENQTGQQN